MAFKGGVRNPYRSQIARDDRDRTAVDRYVAAHLIISGARRYLHLPMTGSRGDLVETDDDGLAGESDRRAAAIEPDELRRQVIARSGRQLSRGWGQLTRGRASRRFCWFDLGPGRNGSGYTKDSRQQRSGSPSHRPPTRTFHNLGGLLPKNGAGVAPRYRSVKYV